MKKTFRRLQFLSSIATIIIAILLSFTVIKQTFFPPQNENSISALKTVQTTSQPVSVPPRNIPVSPIGQTIPINGIDWKKNKKTLVMFISSTCHFCKESTPFYKKMLKDSDNVKFMAVLPQHVEDARSYLQSSGIAIDDVYNAQLGSIGVSGTPTLLLVDENGIVSDVWKGKLTSEKETEVLSKLENPA